MEFDLTQSLLKEMLNYDEKTGIFTWRVKSSRSVKVGQVAGGLCGAGYWQIRINRKPYLAHRLAWLYLYGEWPKGVIDHKSGDTLENKSSNLRDCSRVENNQNMRKSKNNSSGFKGVSFNKKSKKWHASAGLNGKVVYLGYHSTPEKANEAYQDFAKKNHGEFYKETL
jgi:hypothetical protein